MALARHLLRIAVATALALVGLTVSFVVAPVQDSSGIVTERASE